MVGDDVVYECMCLLLDLVVEHLSGLFMGREQGCVEAILAYCPKHECDVCWGALNGVRC